MQFSPVSCYFVGLRPKYVSAPFSADKQTGVLDHDAVLQVILPKDSERVELELYPLNLRLLRHQAQPARAPQTAWTGMVGGYGAAALSKPKSDT